MKNIIEKLKYYKLSISKSKFSKIFFNKVTLKIVLSFMLFSICIFWFIFLSINNWFKILFTILFLVMTILLSCNVGWIIAKINIEKAAELFKKYINE